ncbi:class I SAM-dependent DNA methyltransferase [Negativicoccus succinicivorans]|uniref:type I restriction-modification system subunit M n=1 Tax=Negativicoccus succinicivorans TaxID=620903 RepID=UPI002356AEDF|nr:class I SAM-dependent DNA methyltransferase [Negativicoccus succinicivorans]MBS5889846.1 SAM-dependent DNA methyltransferase [Negativicoccus succinicivorans]MDU0986414.1 class I SAM-dependent DNA methyltransferase [Negativicoccus succinicivorans]MDU1066120.1 class I SAM-dependent DNA methyltransferase [Negativicoccus succinicivorans]
MSENGLSKEFLDDMPVDITKEANFIWGIANKLRGAYMPDKYGDVIIPMTIIRRFECVLEPTKEQVLKTYEKDKNYPARAMYRISGKQFYNTSKYDLNELCNDPDHLAANFKAYVRGFSANVQNILNKLDIENHIDQMHKENCLFNVVKAFSELDLSEEKFDSIKMGYIFENLIGRFYQNVDAGQFYTGRDIIKMMVSVLTAEGCDDIFDDGKVITVLDQACGTGGMLSTAYDHLRHLNPSADIRLFGQELMKQSYAVGFAEMLIKGQDASNFRKANTLMKDCFRDTKIRFLLENPPFGTPYKGQNAKDGQYAAVLREHAKGATSRWPAGLPAGGDSQLLFMQSAVHKMDDKLGRAAIITNGSPLFNGGTSSGESQIRRWLLENDLIEAIIAMPTDLFYNTGIATYVWILSKNKRAERKGKIQLIDATEIYHSLRKSLGNKRREFTRADRKKITELYACFEANERCQIYPNEEFIYREYTVMQPLQRSYKIDAERIENLTASGALNSFYDPAKEAELLEKKEQGETLTKAEEKQLKKYGENEAKYRDILALLRAHISDKKYMAKDEFTPVIDALFDGVELDKPVRNKIIDGLSQIDKEARIERDKKGDIIYDPATKDIEIVNIREDIDVYMAREVLPHVPDARAFFEEDLSAKAPKIKTGAEIPFTRYFYRYEAPRPSAELAEEFLALETLVNQKVKTLFQEDAWREK